MKTKAQRQIGTKARRQERTNGCGRILVVLGLTLAAAAVPANAGPVLSIVGNGTLFPDANGDGPGWVVTAGGTFQVDAILSNTPGSGVVHDSAAFNVSVTGPGNLLYSSYFWNAPYQTGGADDFSIPKGALDTGVVPGTPAIDGALYNLTPAISDIHFEAVMRGVVEIPLGVLVTLTLKAPANVVLGVEYTIAPIVEDFSLYGKIIPTTNGSSLGVIFVPEPATLVLLALGGLASARHRKYKCT